MQSKHSSISLPKWMMGQLFMTDLEGHAVIEMSFKKIL